MLVDTRDTTAQQENSTLTTFTDASPKQIWIYGLGFLTDRVEDALPKGNNNKKMRHPLLIQGVCFAKI